MALYHVSYDLNRPGQDYKDLIAELKKSPDWMHLLGSTWLISTAENSSQLCDRLKKFLDKSDRLFISLVSGERNGWLTQKTWEWINARI